MMERPKSLLQSLLRKFGFYDCFRRGLICCLSKQAGSKVYLIVSRALQTDRAKRFGTINKRRQ